ncbi:hypothetical protein SAY87_009720 [Trapa incisa]|uniref:RING-type E3 ubiquitin transferase n=1 Tax=Trapa incisa TaxID=236973 RepID=A0AAN7K258_9MYRT|nr:hypothetical protein SAY87_009720 [Trapa incisa]
MDEVSGRRAVGKLHPTNRSSIITREASSFLCHGHQPHNRLSSSRMKAGQGGGVCSPQKTKSERISTCLFGTKEVAGSSSRNGSSVSSVRIPKKEAKKKIASQLGMDVSETISIRDEVEESSMKGISVMEVGSSSSGPAWISRSRNSSNSKNLPFSMAKGVRQQPLNPNMSQFGLRNTRCNSMANVFPSGSNSRHNQSLNKRKDLLNGRITGGQTSTYRGKKADETLLSSRKGLSIYESRRNKNYGSPQVQQNLPSVRLSRSSSNPNETNTGSSLNEPHFTFSRLTRQDLPFNGNSSCNRFSHELSDISNNRMEGSSRFSSGSGLPNPGSLGTASHLTPLYENFQQHTIEGISEVMWALERIEQGDSIFERLASLDTSLFLLNSLNIYDQHRDMRMDIDNMTYEELLALEERMGTVSTALTEEALLKCLKRESYQKTKCHKGADADVEKDATKCSICQEEYVDDDEVGRMQCEHMYHVDCINQWLQLKNWCPVCKCSAEPSPWSPRP